MMNYRNLLVTWATLGQLSDTINSYISLQAAAGEKWGPEPTPTAVQDASQSARNAYNEASKLRQSLNTEEQLRKSLEQKVNDLETAIAQLKEADNVFIGNITVVNNKLDQVPIISKVVKEHGNSIDSCIDEDKSLRKKIYDLSDRLDSHDRMNKFICSVYHPALLDGQAKEIYGLICPKAGHDEF